MKIFIDLGAYDGDTIEKAMKVFGGYDKYYGFEPLPSNFKKLKEKFSENNKVEVFNVAASNKNEISKLFLHKDVKNRDENNEGSSLDERKNNINPKNFIEVSAIDFSKFIIENFSIKDEIILKIDVEGKEYDILEKMISDGSIKYIKKIFCEWHNHKIPVSTERHLSVVKKLQEIGFGIKGENKSDEFSKIIPK